MHVVWMILCIAVKNGQWCGVRGDQYDPTVLSYGTGEKRLVSILGLDYVVSDNIFLSRRPLSIH